MLENVRNLPKMDRLLETDAVKQWLKEYKREYVVEKLRSILSNEREKALKGEPIETDPERLVKRLDLTDDFSLKRVVNATGVVLHTNLGRSLLPEAVFDHMKDVSTHYSNLEYDLEKGTRGSRYEHLVDHLKRLTGAEDAHVVNNNAAAVLLVLHALSEGKEAVVSRGELVEIGGSFRIPDVMAISGATLKEVGTTNRTHLSDYERAINSNTTLLMKVHPSNYYIEGFTSTVSIEELGELSKRAGIPLYEDLGSGQFEPLSFQDELLDLRTHLMHCDLISISGDKLLGGPQAGIILGKKQLIERLKKDQLTRALRVDKLTISALEGLFSIYEKRDSKLIPSVRMLERSADEILLQSKAFMEHLEVEATLVEGSSPVGGGSLPKALLKNVKVAIFGGQALADFLREGKVPIITTIQNDQVLIDLRCMDASDEEVVIERLREWMCHE
ncbi:L-seryl-tRNA(Sec) selenium transferase [Guggenheimella bovis]